MIHCLVGALLFGVGVKCFKTTAMASLCPSELMKGLYFYFGSDLNMFLNADLL